MSACVNIPKHLLKAIFSPYWGLPWILPGTAKSSMVPGRGSSLSASVHGLISEINSGLFLSRLSSITSGLLRSSKVCIWLSSLLPLACHNLFINFDQYSYKTLFSINMKTLPNQATGHCNTNTWSSFVCLLVFFFLSIWFCARLECYLESTNSAFLLWPTPPNPEHNLEQRST